ncbi:hypothetical protein BDF22DRAFT_91741 [Syncephalis plumigaleata]|nr:hypothetical protein BDF22DRAFT_91741 [Syncephalis plumigaleata]
MMSNVHIPTTTTIAVSARSTSLQPFNPKTAKVHRPSGSRNSKRSRRHHHRRKGTTPIMTSSTNSNLNRGDDSLREQHPADMNYTIGLSIPRPPNAITNKKCRTAQQMERRAKVIEFDPVPIASRSLPQTNKAASRRPLRLNDNATSSSTIQGAPRNIIRRKAHTTQLSSETLAKLAAFNAASVNRSRTSKEYRYVQASPDNSALSQKTLKNELASPVSYLLLRSRKSSSSIHRTWEDPTMASPPLKAYASKKRAQAGQFDAINQPSLDNSEATLFPPSSSFGSSSHSNSAFADALMDDRNFLSSTRD